MTDEHKEYEIINGFIHIPEKEFELIKQKLAAQQTILDYYDAVNNNKTDKKRMLPVNLRYDLLTRTQNPVKLIRKHRGLTQRELARKSGISKAMISYIETGKKQGSTKTLRNIARALNVDISDLI